MRFWSELRHPELKCKRVGHKEREQYRSGYTWAKEWRYVADSVEQKRCVCSRCREVLTDWQDTSRRGLTGLTMDTDRMRVLDEVGEIWS